MALANWPARPRAEVPATRSPALLLPRDGCRPTVLTLTLGETAHSSCRVEPARRRGRKRGRDQHRRVRTAVPPVTEGTPPLRRTRSAGACARRSRVWLSLLRHGPARPGAPGRDAAPVAVAARGGQGAARMRSGRCGETHRRALAPRRG